MKTTKLPKMKFYLLRTGMAFIYRNRKYYKTCNNDKWDELNKNTNAMTYSGTMRSRFFKNDTVVIPLIHSYPEYYGKKTCDRVIKNELAWADKVLNNV